MCMNKDNKTPTQTKTCTICKEVKLATEFYKDRSKKYGIQNECKVCHNKRYADWYKTNTDKVRNRDLERRYGVTIEQYNKMFEKQNGKCYICQRHQSQFKISLAVDHNHRTGSVRGLLCYTCNKNIVGLLRTVRIETR